MIAYGLLDILRQRSGQGSFHVASERSVRVESMRFAEGEALGPLRFEGDVVLTCLEGTFEVAGAGPVGALTQLVVPQGEPLGLECTSPAGAVQLIWAPPFGRGGVRAKGEEQEEENPFFQDLRSQWLHAVRSDRTELGLWAAAADVRDAVGPNVAWDLVRSTTMQALAPLLRAGELVAVDLGPGGEVVRWPGGPEAWIARIESEWVALGRDLAERFMARALP